MPTRLFPVNVPKPKAKNTAWCCLDTLIRTLVQIMFYSIPILVYNRNNISYELYQTLLVLGTVHKYSGGGRWLEEKNGGGQKKFRLKKSSDPNKSFDHPNT